MITHEEARYCLRCYSVPETSGVFDYIAQQKARDAEMEKLRAQLAAAQARADGLARECKAWRTWDHNLVQGNAAMYAVDPSRPTHLPPMSKDLVDAMKESDAAGWLEGKP